MEKNKIYNLTAFGDTLKYIRGRMNMTQKQISEHAGICHDTYFNIENGAILPTPDTMIALSNVCKTDLIRLMILEFKSEKSYEIEVFKRKILKLNKQCDPTEIKEYEYEIKKLLKYNHVKSCQKLSVELQQLLLLCHSHQYMISNKFHYMIFMSRQGLGLTMHNFSLQNINEYNFSDIEMRFVLYLLIAHFKTCYQDSTLEYFKKLIKEVMLSKSHQSSLCILYHQTICDFSRDFFLAGQLEKTIQLCSLGIMLEKHYFHKKTAYHHHYLMRYAEQLIKLSNYELSLSRLYKEMIEFIDY